MSLFNILIVTGVIAALAAVELPGLIYSVSALAVMGAALSAAFFLLGEPDLAIVLFGIEVVLIVFLVRALKFKSDRAGFRMSEWPEIMSVLIFGAVFLMICFRVFKTLPLPGFAEAGSGASALYNLIGATAAVCAALVGSWTLRHHRREKEGPDER